MALCLELQLHRTPVALVSNRGYGINLKLQTKRCALCASRLQAAGSQEPAAVVQPAEAGGGASGPPRRPRLTSHGGYGRGGRREPFRPQQSSPWSAFLELAAPRVPDCIGMVAIGLGLGLGLRYVGQGISSSGAHIGAGIGAGITDAGKELRAGVTKAGEQLGVSLVTAGTQLGSDLATKTFQPESKTQGLAGATSVLGEKAMKKGVEIVAIWAVCKYGPKLMEVLGSWWKPPPPPV